MLEYLMFILIIFLMVLLFVYFFVFQFQKSHKVNGVSHWKKLSPNTLTVSGEERNGFGRW